MQTPLCLLLIAVAFSPLAARAGVDPQPAPFHLNGEYDAEASYVGSAEVRREGRSHSLDENSTLARVVATRALGGDYLRLGLEWERYSFGLDRGSPLPNTLQSLKAILGFDTRFGDSIIARFEIQPGFYGASFDHISSGDFNVPFTAGGTYLLSPDFQWILGVSVDLNRKYPVLPAAGFRWKFAPRLVASAILPAPRLEYEVTRGLTAYAGAELKGGSYRVDGDYGERTGNPSLDHAVLTFSEVRTGGGFTWKVSPTMALTGEGGAQVEREFDFFRTNARYHSEGIAPYAMLSLHGTF